MVDGVRSPDAKVVYGPHELNVADVYLPAAESVGLVVLIHGGFWRNRYDRMHLRPLADSLAGNGFSVALPEYRRVGDAGGGHPGTVDDIALAVSALPDLVDALSPRPLARVAVVGHSAGGQLAIGSPARAAGFELVVSLAGVLDLVEAHRLRLSSGAVAEFLRESEPGFTERLALADPMQLPVPGRTVLVHGSEDPDVPVEFSRAYARRDPRIEYRELPGAGHFEPIDPPVLLELLLNR